MCWIGEVERFDWNSKDSNGSRRGIGSTDEYQEQTFQRIYEPELARKYLSSLELWQDGMDRTYSIHHAFINLIVRPNSPRTLRAFGHEVESGVFDLPVVEVGKWRDDEEWEESVRGSMLSGLPRIWTRDLGAYAVEEQGGRLGLTHPRSSGVLEGEVEEACLGMDPKPFFGWEGEWTFRN
ncbi:hypothetical protein DL98DRAFT_590959 [Cadophora sp. DSE1049]|nr:hypothetical protein DL98DRAFT_590959 [Cadophora sp. DSE1049]